MMNPIDTMNSFCTVLLFYVVTIFSSAVIGIPVWDHSVNLNDDYRLLWTVNKPQQPHLGVQEITFEIQVRTSGYIGFGFSRDGSRAGADIVIGWVDHGQTYFQDRHIKKHGDGEPSVDPSQDYILLLGYENATHTVMRFKRKLDTCDTSYDIPITNDTMRVVYMYDRDEPVHGSIVPGSLPNPQQAYKGYVPLLITQRMHDEALAAPVSSLTSRNMLVDAAAAAGNSNNNNIVMSHQLHIFEALNEDVRLPQGDDTLYWCKVFEFEDFNQKQHLVKYEPVFDSSRSRDFLQHIILYECQGTSPHLEALSRENGRPCMARNNPNIPCNAIVAAWFKGSESFTFPPDAGYPLDSKNERFYMMETHYSDSEPPKDLESLHADPIVDNSGLKLYYTSALRKHDAGVLSIGMDPNWRHIIPPLQDKVISEGHCIDDCTKRSFPPQGISIFAVIMQTHNIGKEVKLRQTRKQEELLPIAVDRNIHAGYAEYHRMTPPVRVMPGDRLIAECTYNSSQRTAITLGGLTTREESCNVYAVYYPRQKKLTTCHSLPSLPTVLHSLGIGELALGSNPVLIASPPELAGMTLESRLISYDWENQFDVFQKVTRNGSLRPICFDAKNNVLQNTDTIESHSPVLTKYWQTPPSACSKAGGKQNTDHHHSHHHTTITHDSKSIYVTEMANNGIKTAGVRKNAANDDSEAESMSLNGVSSTHSHLCHHFILFIMAISTFLFAT